MNYKHATWRKLYVEEDGDFALLPWLARAAAGELLKACDDSGRISIGAIKEGESPSDALVKAVAFRMGATRGDRRMMAQMFPLLFKEGYLVHRGNVVVIRNFVAAQRRWDKDEPATPAQPAPPPSNDPTTIEQRPCNEAATNEQRSGNDRATNEQRTGNEAATEPDVTTRKHTDQDASAHAYARGSVPSSSLPNSSEGEEEKPRVIELTLDPPPPSKPKPPSDVDRVFDHWRKAMNSPRSKMDNKRRARIEWALAEHDFETCVQAIDGCALSDFHMGHDPKTNGAKHNGIKVIFRDADQVDRFVGIWNEQRAAVASAPAAIVFDPSIVAANLEAKRKIAEIGARLRSPLTEQPDSLDPMEASNG
jgi:hypothetical protein